MVRQLIGEGWDINLIDDIGETPLHCAVGEKKIEAARILLDSGADPNLRDVVNNGYTPLDSVVNKCSVEMAKLLLSFGADPTIKTWMNVSALERADQRSNDDPVYQLLARWRKKMTEGNKKL